jgi:hypothetical protein
VHVGGAQRNHLARQIRQIRKQKGMLVRYLIFTNALSFPLTQTTTSLLRYPKSKKLRKRKYSN